jgi:replicative DNA helicase
MPNQNKKQLAAQIKKKSALRLLTLILRTIKKAQEKKSRKAESEMLEAIENKLFK